MQKEQLDEQLRQHMAERHGFGVFTFLADPAAEHEREHGTSWADHKEDAR